MNFAMKISNLRFLSTKVEIGKRSSNSTFFEILFYFSHDFLIVSYSKDLSERVESRIITSNSWPTLMGCRLLTPESYHLTVKKYEFEVHIKPSLSSCEIWCFLSDLTALFRTYAKGHWELLRRLFNDILGFWRSKVIGGLDIYVSSYIKATKILWWY